MAEAQHNSSMKVLRQRAKSSLIMFLSACATFFLTVDQPFALTFGDGMLLKRSTEETCHACHKTDQNAPADPDSIKSHNSANTGSTKWAPNGWGISGGKYGKFVCTTCHTAHGTSNIYLIRESIPTPDNSLWGSSGTQSVTVDFRQTAEGVGPGTMGYDNQTHISSTMVCEACHSYSAARTNGVGWFAYNMASAVPHSPAIPAGVNCTACHNHKGGFKGSCTNCHGFPPINDSTMLNAGAPFGATGRTVQFTPSPKAAGAHAKHYTTLGFGCDTCHTGGGSLGSHNANPPRVQIGFSLFSGAYISGSYDAPAFSNASYAVAAGNAGTTVTATGPARTCTNIYCHSSAQSAAGGVPPVYASPVWEGSAMNCGSCHKDMDTDSSAPGSHVQHAQGSVTNYPCATCHNGYTETSVSSATHVNNSINLVFSGTASGTTYSTGNTHAPGSGYGNCTTSNCHGTRTGARSPNWGGNTSNYTCTKCHGNPTIAGSYVLYKAAPGADGLGVNLAGQTGTITNYVSNDPQVGAHDAHLRGIRNYTNPIACPECHLVPVNVGDPGHFDASPADLTWGTLATTGGLVPVWNSTNCSSNYCHGAKLPSGASGNGSNMAPLWTDQTYLTGTPNAAGDCGRCHQAPPQTSVHIKTAPSTYYALNECSICHGHVNVDGTFNDKSKHVNGIVEVKCNGCHDYDVAGATYNSGTGKWTGGTWGKNAKDGLTPTQGYGAHALHINHIKGRLGYNTTSKVFTDASFGTADAQMVCGTCHTNIAGNHTTDNSSGRLINFGDGTYKEGGSSGFSFLFDPAATSGLPTGLPRPTYNGASGVSSATQLKTCSAVGCHFTTTPVWSAY